MYNGIINVYKEAGFTSFDVVAKLRGILGQKKIGHTGTLDPDATGVLPIVAGNATRLVDMLTDKQKEYVAEFKLGVRTDTLDASGRVTETAPVTCEEEKIREVILSFAGDIMQIPPMYSAIKVDGKKLYELARQGKEIERKPRPVTIHKIDILSVDRSKLQIRDGNIVNGPDICDGPDVIDTYAVKMRVLCSKGTYIRTLCDDIGKKLGCFGVMTSLERTKSGAHTKERSYTLGQITALCDEGRLDEIIEPVDSVFSQYPEYVAKGETLRLIRNGNQIVIPDMTDECVRIYGDDSFIALYELKDEKRHLYKAKMMFL